MARELPTLGGLIGNWIQAHVAIGDGDRAGDPYLLTSEMWRFLGHFYALDPETGKFAYPSGGMLARPQKWGKSPFAAAVVCAEAAGPVRFAGWSENGQPEGRAPATPLIQIAATTEDQAANTWRALLPMLQLGAIHHTIDDAGETRINLPGGGRIEPVSSAHRSRHGARLTFAVMDEPHLWTRSNGGVQLADTLRRNLAGMGGRWMATTNAFDPSEDSVAQQITESAEEGVWVDDVEPGRGSVRNKAEVRRMLKRVYGDSASGCEAQGNAEGFIPGWVDLERIASEVASLAERDAAQAERFFLHRKQAAESRAFDAERWAELAEEDHDFAPGEPKLTMALGDKGYYSGGQPRIVIGVDGARFVDSLAAIATEVETGYQWPIGIWTRPESAGDDYEHPLDEVDGAMTEAFNRFDVERTYIDPQFIENWLDTWQGRWGDHRVLPWYTNRPRQMAHAVRTFADAIAAGNVSHNGDEDFAAHIKNATRRPVSVYDDDHRQLYVIGKDRPNSPRKMDAAVAAVISWEARRDVMQAGTPEPASSVVYT